MSGHLDTCLRGTTTAATVALASSAKRYSEGYRADDRRSVAAVTDFLHIDEQLEEYIEVTKMYVHTSHPWEKNDSLEDEGSGEERVEAR